MKVKKMLINGEWRAGTKSFAVESPFTGERIAVAAMSSRDEMEEVIASAETAADEMRRLPRYKIAEGLRKIAAGIEKGIPDEGMPAFKGKLTDQQIKDVVNYIRTELQRK